MQDNLSLREVQKEWHGTLRHYVIGFILSIFLSGVAFFLVMADVVIGTTIVYILIGLAIVQAIGQIIYFLHIGKEEKPRWETGLLLFMAMVVLIVVMGSLWIMFDLNKRTMEGMMPSKEMQAP